MTDASYKRDLLPGALDLMVLHTLALEPLHTYALAARIQQQSQERLQIEPASLYPALQRLLKAGLVHAQWEISPAKRNVRTYSLTEKGRRHFKREASKLQAMILGIRQVLAPLPEPQS
ncbi:PadR family transcriptional regulator [Silvibacterium sp.]|uniref:PadR family transcriptional regulator n=1 Tax=Silvibacterium sp. TaxID=1964179 RepID=UPI0039E61047